MSLMSVSLEKKDTGKIPGFQGDNKRGMVFFSLVQVSLMNWNLLRWLTGPPIPTWF